MRVETSDVILIWGRWCPHAPGMQVSLPRANRMPRTATGSAANLAQSLTLSRSFTLPHHTLPWA